MRSYYFLFSTWFLLSAVISLGTELELVGGQFVEKHALAIKEKMSKLWDVLRHFKWSCVAQISASYPVMCGNLSIEWK